MSFLFIEQSELVRQACHDLICFMKIAIFCHVAVCSPVGMGH